MSPPKNFTYCSAIGSPNPYGVKRNYIAEHSKRPLRAYVPFATACTQMSSDKERARCCTEAWCITAPQPLNVGQLIKIRAHMARMCTSYSKPRKPAGISELPFGADKSGFDSPSALQALYP
eukprot:m.193645 g.193645  ORF g.193645 m.193645 type:complete len:121 (+) comp18637_c0_seq3:2136-2498(+)